MNWTAIHMHMMTTDKNPRPRGTSASIASEKSILTAPRAKELTKQVLDPIQTHDESNQVCYHKHEDVSDTAQRTQMSVPPKASILAKGSVEYQLTESLSPVSH